MDDMPNDTGRELESSPARAVAGGGSLGADPAR